MPSLDPDKVFLSIGFVALITLANLRGVRESGILFAVPTYGFIVSIYVLVVTGMVKCATGGCARAVLPPHRELLPIGTAGAVGLFVLLHAFSSGSTALTGVEAISNGVPAFRRPQSKNAAETLALMGFIAITMFLGISFLAAHSHPLPSDFKSVVAQIADGVFGHRGAGGAFVHGFMYYFVQIFTAAILILAANTSFQDFPRLSSILAHDRFMPRQFENRGDRLVFSNGVILLAVFASILIWVFEANLDRLIQLYVVGVFTSFTLSQSGMVRHWLKVKRRGGAGAKGWKRSIVINAIGATATFIVLAVVIDTKFKHGAWIVIAAMPVIVAIFYGINRHYERVWVQLRQRPPTLPEPATNTVVLYVESLDAATARAVGYVRSFAGGDFRAIHVPGERSPSDLALRWKEFSRAEIPLQVLPDGHPVASVIEYVRSIERGPDDYVTVVLPEMMPKRTLLSAIRRGTTFYLKVRLLSEPQVVITDVPVVVGDLPPPLRAEPIRALIPKRTEVVVFISAAHDATARAINYARTLKSTAVRAVYFAFDAHEVQDIQREWEDRRIPIELDIVEAPFRDLTAPILEEVRRITKRPDSIASVIVPELVVKKWWHNALHNHRPVFIKRLLLFEPGVILSSVPYLLK